MDFSDLKGMFGEVKTRMDGAIERVRRDMANVRTGRATVGLLDGVQVDAYGSKMPINQVATLSIPEPALMLAQPSMIRRPVVEAGDALLVGFDPDAWRAVLS